jgi:excisionase family DNA binding protein
VGYRKPIFCKESRLFLCPHGLRPAGFFVSKRHFMNTTPQPLVHSPDHAAQRIGTSTRAIYDLIAKGELRSFKTGKRRLIPETELQQFVQRKMAQAVTA